LYKRRTATSWMECYAYVEINSNTEDSLDTKVHYLYIFFLTALCYSEGYVLSSFFETDRNYQSNDHAHA